MVSTHSFFRLLIVAGLFALLTGCGNLSIGPVKTKLRVGDQAIWAQARLNDTLWQNTNGTTSKGIFWVRFHFLLPPGVARNRPWGIQITSLGSYDAYWDGRLMGRNGRVGNNQSAEVPGRHSISILLPDSLARPGNHVLALRVSNHYYQNPYAFFNARVNDYQQLVTYPLKMAALMALLAGAFLIGAIYYFLLFIHHRSEQLFLVFSVICALFLSLLIAEYLPVFWPYLYPVQTYRLEVIGVLTCSIAFLIPYFLNRQFRSIPSRAFHTGLAAVLLFIFCFYHGRYDYSAQLLSLAMGIAGLLVSMIAVYRKSEGAFVVLIAILLGITTVGYIYFDYSLYLSFGFLLLGMLYLLTRRLRAIEQAYRQTQLLSERLKTELLKKSIQPHFLMNTLTTLIDWVEEAPASGVAMIRALSAELGLLSRMADRQLVPVYEEIELCRYHLQVMHFRKEIDYQWEATGILPGESLPPAILHTVLENGITHSKPLPDGSVRFHLDFIQHEKIKTYTLRTYAKNRDKTHPVMKGTGLLYIEARLNESYGSSWRLVSEAVPHGWQTIITLFG